MLLRSWHPRPLKVPGAELLFTSFMIRRNQQSSTYLALLCLTPPALLTHPPPQARQRQASRLTDVASHLIILSHKLSRIPRGEPSLGKFNSPPNHSLAPLSPPLLTLVFPSKSSEKVQQSRRLLGVERGSGKGRSSSFRNPPSQLSLPGTRGSSLCRWGG